MSKISTIAILLIGALAGAAVGAAVVNYLGLIPTTGDFYTTLELQFEPTSVYWGNLTFGENSTQTVNITNTGNQAINLTASVANASLSLINYSVEWDAEALILNPSQSLLANFTLTIWNATDGGFNFDIVIGDQT